MHPAKSKLAALRAFVLLTLVLAGPPRADAGGWGSVTADTGGNPVVAAGNVLQIGLPVLALATTGFYGREGDGDWGDAGGRAMFWRTYGASMAVTYGLKYGLDAERPNGGHHSFPSGHTAAAFAAASFLQERYGWKAGAPALAAATLTGYSRIEANAHYPRDVVAAAAISSSFAHGFTDRWHHDVTVSPWTDGDAAGIQFAFRF